MKTKEEQLKIYSAYLPYNVRITLASEKYNYDGLTTILHPHYLLDWQRNECTMKLHLYDLSYLTQEIEHEGEMFIPIEVLKLMDIGAEIFSEEGFLYHTLDLPYKCVERLLEWHFNVFSLSENEFINKAELN